MSYDHVETVGGKMQWTQAAVRRRSPTNGEFAAFTHGVEQRRPENGKMKCFYYYNYYYYNQTQHSKIYGVFETLTNK